MFLSARSWSPEDTAQTKPFGDSSNIYRVPGFERMDREGGVHFTGGRTVPCIDTVSRTRPDFQPDLTLSCTAVFCTAV